ncbi:RNA polymerase sigma factor [Sphingomonadaceae bacterium OTU29MARTA1]|nr:RNA polymerase sigma factor [Sphingomonadaceae bacterium OTU29LAMAA1]USU07974.1 RNA polymerase sigma factor [Sphingomonadaceae bacterium OTU29MARTA1]
MLREVMPHEPGIRVWLRQRGQSAEDIDDLIQEGYAKLAGVTAFAQIAQPGGYFFQIVRNLMIDSIRHARVVRIDTVGHLVDQGGGSDDVTPERIALVRDELSSVMRCLETLPDRCRAIFKLRKIDGLSQREIAAKMGVSESIVENDAAKGLTLLMRAMRRDVDTSSRVSK